MHLVLQPNDHALVACNVVYICARSYKRTDLLNKPPSYITSSSKLPVPPHS